MKFYESDEFRKLKEEWYDKLKSDGFKDIEKTVDKKERLIQYFSLYKPHLEDVNNKADYYQTLTYYVNLYEFDNETDRIIMKRRSEAIKIKDICVELKSLSLEPRGRESVRYIIRKYEMKWGIKNYPFKQVSASERVKKWARKWKKTQATTRS